MFSPIFCAAFADRLARSVKETRMLNVVYSELEVGRSFLLKYLDLDTATCAAVLL